MPVLDVYPLRTIRFKISIHLNKGRTNGIEIIGNYKDIPPCSRVFRSSWNRGLIMSFCDWEKSLVERNGDLTKDTLKVQTVKKRPDLFRIHSLVFDRLLESGTYGRTTVFGLFINPYTVYIPWDRIVVDR